MAALQKIRSHGAILVGVIAVALALFVIGDGIRGGESFLNESKQQLAKWMERKCPFRVSRLDQVSPELYEIATQKSSFSEDEMNQINDEAWQTYVQNKLIEKECKALGIAVSDEEVANAIKLGQSQMLQIPYFMNQLG